MERGEREGKGREIEEEGEKKRAERGEREGKGRDREGEKRERDRGQGQGQKTGDREIERDRGEIERDRGVGSTNMTNLVHRSSPLSQIIIT